MGLIGRPGPQGCGAVLGWLGWVRSDWIGLDWIESRLWVVTGVQALLVVVLAQGPTAD